MGTFIAAEDDPVLYTDKEAVPGQSLRGLTPEQVWHATEANGVRDALMDCRTAIRTGLPDSGLDALMTQLGAKGFSQSWIAAVGISDSDTTAAVDFSSVGIPTDAGMETGYTIHLSVGATTGTPADTDTYKVWWTEKGADGFTINLGAAPGAGVTVTVHLTVRSNSILLSLP